MMFLFNRTPVVRHPRKARTRTRREADTRDLQVRVTLVVPKQDVVFGIERLDEIVFQQQRLGFRTHHRGFHARDLAHHVPDARAAMIFLEIVRHPFFQVDGFAHIEHCIVRIEIAVHTRQCGQARHVTQQLLGVNGR